jgi:hypothetical protein
MFGGTSTCAEPYGAREGQRALLLMLNDFRDQRECPHPDGGGKVNRCIPETPILRYVRPRWFDSIRLREFRIQN